MGVAHGVDLPHGVVHHLPVSIRNLQERRRGPVRRHPRSAGLLHGADRRHDLRGVGPGLRLYFVSHGRHERRVPPQSIGQGRVPLRSKDACKRARATRTPASRGRSTWWRSAWARPATSSRATWVRTATAARWPACVPLVLVSLSRPFMMTPLPPTSRTSASRPPLSTSWTPSLKQVNTLVDTLVKAGKDSAQQAANCDCTVSTAC